MKKTRSPKTRSISILLLACALLVYYGCNVREPGCLDIDAENFDFEAERHDASLCVYPDLILNVLYQWADSSLQTGFLYRNAHGMDYAIHGVQILFSGFIVQNGAGDELAVNESIPITLGECGSGNVIEVPDDFVFTDRSAFNYVIGPFAESGLMQHVKARVGVDDNYTPLCLESLPANHLLRGSRAAYDPDIEEFALGRFIVSRDSVNAVRDTFYTYGVSESLDFDIMRTFRQGRRDTLYMSIDFHRIFDPVNLSMDHTSIAQELASRISASVDIH